MSAPSYVPDPDSLTDLEAAPVYEIHAPTHWPGFPDYPPEDGPMYPVADSVQSLAQRMVDDLSAADAVCRMAESTPDAATDAELRQAGQTIDQAIERLKVHRTRITHVLLKRGANRRGRPR